MLVYNQTTGQVREEQLRVPQQDEVVWIRLSNPGNDEVKHVLEDLFHCHPLLVEDCVKMNQRPKIDRYKDNCFIYFFAAGKDLSPQGLGIVVGPNYVVTIGKQKLPFLDEVYKGFLEIEGRLTHTGDILYRILDRCVDQYFEVVNYLEAQIDRMERGIYRNPYLRIAQDIFRMKRSLHKLRRIFTDEKLILDTLRHHIFPFIRPEDDLYFLDVNDHISRVIDSIDVFRESANGILEMQMNMKADRMNEIMKILTIISSIFLPLTFIVGLYGMNFKNIPELNWKYGYVYVWCLLIVVAVAMWIYYKRKKWL